MPETPHNSWVYLKGTDPDTTTLGSMSDLQDGDITTLESSSEDTLSRDLERVSLGSLGKWTWDIHSIILDLSPANFIDTVAIKTLRNVSVKNSVRNCDLRVKTFKKRESKSTQKEGALAPPHISRTNRLGELPNDTHRPT